MKKLSYEEIESMMESIGIDTSDTEDISIIGITTNANITSVMMYQHTCNSCGHFWLSKTPTEICCPKCTNGKLINYISLPVLSNIPAPCQGCSNHPSNGGSGVCHCTLGSPITC